MSDLAGKTVAGYPIEKLLSKGSYADTWQVSTSDKPLAVKIVHAQFQSDAALNAEIAKGWEASRAAQHENVVVAYGAGIEPELGAYCLQELVRGKALRQLVLDAAKLAWRDFLITAEQIVAALHALHAAKVLHGDIWSGSILITQDQDLKLEGAGGLMHLTRRSAELLTGPGIGYQAPEVLAGCPVSAESDIYGVGATLYALLASHDPYPPENAERLLQIVTDKKLPRASALRDDLPPEAEELLGRLLSHDPRQRYGAAADLLADIRRLKDGEALAPLRGGKAPSSPRPSSRPAAAPAKPKSNVGPAAAAAKTAANIKAVSGFSPPLKPQSGADPSLKPPSGMATAVGASSSGLRAIKEGTAAKNIFGRLDTHVKSTIPQSDVEKKGDDHYRQGNLSAALTMWREAYDATPHTGLKVKLDLAERDIKRETVTGALEEAQMLLDDGDYAGAIARAQDALLAAEDDTQRQEALKIEKEAGEKSVEHQRAKRTKLMIAGAVVLIIIIVGALLMFRGKGTPQGPSPNSGSPLKDCRTARENAFMARRFHEDFVLPDVFQRAPWGKSDRFSPQHSYSA